MTYQAEVLADSPLQYFRMDETSGTSATNLGSGGGVGAYINAPTLAQTGLISQGTAVRFAAASAQDMTISASLLTTNGSFEFWFKWSAGAAGAVIIRDNTLSSGWIIGIDNSGTFGVRVAGVTFNTSLATSTVRDNQTHHFVMDKAGTSLQVYIDGNKVMDVNTAANTSSTGVWHVSRNGTTTSYTDVTVDELAIYAAALGQTRVSAHYAAGAAPVSPPANTVAPAVTTDGSPATTETISVSSGTWTGWSGTPAPTYQWKRAGASITGATSNSYTLQAADEGLAIKCSVTVTNSGGSTSADSNAITPAVSSPLSIDDIELRLSGGPSNASPANSYGGVESSVTVGVDLFDSVAYPAAQAGQVDYRLIYVHNAHPTYTAGFVAYVSIQEAAGQSIEIGVATEAAGQTVGQTASKLTAPAGVTFSAPLDAGTGISLGTVPHNSSRGLWIKWAINPSTPGSDSNPGAVAIEVAQQ